MTFLTILAFNKEVKGKQSFQDSHGHNIFRIVVVKSNYLFTTSKTKHDYYE